MKARTAGQVRKFTDIPNVGPRIARDFATLGMKQPTDLCNRDAFAMYAALCQKTKTRHDPCVLDTFMAVVDFMNGGTARAWWEYTAARKKQYPNI